MTSPPPTPASSADNSTSAPSKVPTPHDLPGRDSTPNPAFEYRKEYRRNAAQIQWGLILGAVSAFVANLVLMLLFHYWNSPANRAVGGLLPREKEIRDWSQVGIWMSVAMLVAGVAWGVIWRRAFRAEFKRKFRL